MGRATKATTKGNAKDIRTQAQKNRELAYDVGDKVGGARKDDFEARFKEKPTLEGLANLEKENSAVAEKLVTKANLLPKVDFQAEHDNGADLQTALMKKLDLKQKLSFQFTELVTCHRILFCSKITLELYHFLESHNISVI